MLKYLAIAASCAAAVLFVSLVGMLALYSLQQPKPHDQEQPAAAEGTNRQDGNARIGKVTTQDGNQEASNKRQWYYSFVDRPTDWLLVLFNGLLVLATVALFVSGERSVDAARKSAEAAQKAAEAAQKSVAVAESGIRPWIAIDEIRPADIYFNGGYAFVDQVEFVLRNVGRSPAVNVRVEIYGYAKVPGQQYGEVELANQKKICEGTVAAAFDVKMLGKAIFPGDTFVEGTGSNIEVIPKQWPFKTIVPILVGCVHYRLHPDGEDYKTGFIILVSTTRPNGIEMIDGNRVPKEELKFNRMSIGNFAS
jgi:hypothetical protein